MVRISEGCCLLQQLKPIGTGPRVGLSPWTSRVADDRVGPLYFSGINAALCCLCFRDAHVHSILHVLELPCIVFSQKVWARKRPLVYCYLKSTNLRRNAQ